MASQLTGISFLLIAVTCFVATACLIPSTVFWIVGFMGAGAVMKNLLEGLATTAVPGLIGVLVIFALGRIKKDFSSPVPPVPVFPVQGTTIA